MTFSLEQHLNMEINFLNCVNTIFKIAGFTFNLVPFNDFDIVDVFWVDGFLIFWTILANFVEDNLETAKSILAKIAIVTSQKN